MPNVTVLPVIRIERNGSETRRHMPPPSNVVSLKAHRRAAQIREFESEVWSGCTHLDCLPECRHAMEGSHCERFERAFRVWNTKSVL